jgi:UDP-N-acetylmuramate dehydrogenase
MPSAERHIKPAAHVPLAPMTTLGVGGHARWFTCAETVEDVAAASRWCGDAGVPLVVLGGGTNMVVADEGVDGLVLQVAIRGADFGPRGSRTTLRLGAGEPWDGSVAAAVSQGLAGLECLSGIPGSVGGTPVQNVGAYGQEVAQTIVEVTALDRQSGDIVTLGGGECGFGYRTSRFKREDEGRFVVCEVLFELAPGLPTVTYPDVLRQLAHCEVVVPGLADVRDAVLAVRRRKGMVIDAADPDTRSVGSFFMNPVVDAERHAAFVSAAAGPVPGFVRQGGQVKMPAAWLIEQTGFAPGYQSGAVGLSSKHPLAIINRGAAAARDIVVLAGLIKRQVIDRFGIWLRAEPTFIGFGDDPDVAFLKEVNVDTSN